ncbi:lipopolysaccharide assembly protein LapA domain-containing protein [Propionivibrio sp.]|uniref:lipopolysaccharide assembly protein LapA domain-containing protein n=1 Tax=Propionivibrio sp. TaxID=2212460 RepID=UPI0026080C98|nr:lipopolysaccharide assembly protein LapA domain-containing protein [Propionivibrio sp.]
MQLLTIFAILFTIGGVMFALQNNVPVMVSFALWQFDGSLALVLLIALALGALIAALVSTPATLRMQWTISRQKSHIARLENDCANMERQLSEFEQKSRAEHAIPLNAPPEEYVGLKQLITGSPPHWQPVEGKSVDSDADNSHAGPSLPR